MLIRRAFISIVFVGALLELVGGCGDGRQVTEKDRETVEVAPGQFIEIEREDVLGASRFVDGIRDESTALATPWDGKTVRWKGSQVPASLRASEGKLHLITFDRVKDPPRLRFYRQNGAGDGFDEIEAGNYPKNIAMQNMWFGNPNDFSRGANGRKIYEVEMARQLDPEDIYFADSLTANLWCQLQTGKPYHEVRRLGSEQKQAILRDFAAAHPPIKLTVVKRMTTQATQPATQG